MSFLKRVFGVRSKGDEIANDTLSMGSNSPQLKANTSSDANLSSGQISTNSGAGKSLDTAHSNGMRESGYSVNSNKLNSTGNSSNTLVQTPSSTTSLTTLKSSSEIPFIAPVDAVTAAAAYDSGKGSYGNNGNGCSLKDFDVKRTLGTGSFGRVLLAFHRSSNSYYAIKKLRKADVVRLRQVEHTNNERSLLVQVQHPFLVRLMATFQDTNHLYLVMEYVGGGELFSLLRKVKTLPPFVAQFYAAEVLLALEYLHQRNILYRDLKPENILINAEGHICITDFGFAKVVPKLTWTLCGTPDYLAPEIVLSQGYSRAVDVYALGVLIYEMLLGAPPFYDETPARLYENIVRMQPRFPQGFDPIARNLLEGLLEKNPEARLGAREGSGIAEVKWHPWFRSVNWELLEARRIRPPFRPTISHPGDTANFDEYPEESLDCNEQSIIIDQAQFDGLFPGF